MPNTKTAQHTPGPWRIHWTGRNVTSGNPPDINRGDIPNVISDNHYICELWQNGNGWNHMEANARLIAAAPDLKGELQATARLLASALDNMPYFFPKNGLKENLTAEARAWRKEFQEQVRVARAAIAKAEGSQDNA